MLILSDPTNKQGLFEVVKHLSGQDSLAFARFVALANLAKDDYTHLAITENQRWELDDSVNTDFSEATATVNSSETHVPLEEEMISVNEVQWDGKIIQPVDRSQLTENTFLDKYGSSGTPTHYDYRNQSLFFYPLPDTTGTVKVYYSRPYTHFSVSETDTELGVLPIHQNYLVYHILDALNDRTNDKNMNKIANKLLQYEDKVKNFFGYQDKDTPKKFTILKQDNR